MRKFILVSLISLSIFMFTALTLQANAAVVGIGTFDASTGEPKSTFEIGEDILVIVISSDWPITLTLTLPDGSTRNLGTYDWDGTTNVEGIPAYMGVWDDITEHPGSYELKAESTVAELGETQYAVTPYHVIPEAPLGVAAVLTACFAGFWIQQVLPRAREERP